MEKSPKKEDENDNFPLRHVDSIMPASVFNCRSNYVIRHLVLQIENQNTFSGFVYDKLSTCENFFTKSPALSRFEFIRIWKYCLLQRAFELRLRLTGEPLPSYLLCVKPNSIPVPLAQLLQSLGSVRCPYTGLNVQMMPPVLNERCLPLWAVYNNFIIDKWNQFMGSISSNYNPSPTQNKHAVYGAFPAPDDCEGKSVGLTAKKVVQNLTSVRCASTIVKKNDLLIRVCHDELFVDPVCSYSDMLVEFPDNFDANVIRLDYLRYYYSCLK